MSENSQIRNFFKNQTIFLTGSTGFLGKVLLEKLLRECHDLKKIYILIRPRKGKTSEQRFKELFDFECFRTLKSKNINVAEKVFLIEGDSQLPFLGISPSDIEILKNETTCVLHLAYDVRFDQKLRDAFYNVRATLYLMNLAKEMPNLKVFVYVSTAFSHCIDNYTQEKIYDPPITYETLLALVKGFDDDILEKITPSLLGKWPNTYVYTKSISESLVKEASNLFPTTIVRPAIVVNSFKEPMPGWIDNVYGLTGIIMGAGLGIIRTFCARLDFPSWFVPVDIVCNCILASAWKTHENASDVTIYNCVGLNGKPLNHAKLTKIIWKYYWPNASSKMLWYNTFKMRENKRCNDVCVFFLHKIPAYIVDFVLLCMGKSQKAVKIYKKIDNALDSLAYFSTRLWSFDDDNVKKLWNEMGDDDRKLFNFDMENFNWENYINESIQGIKAYLTKETSPEEFTKGQRRIRIFFVVHYAFLGIILFLLLKFVFYVFNLFFFN